jgi:hypothetical protein
MATLKVDRTAVGPARRVLQSRDQPHRAHFGRPDHRTAREQRPENLLQPGLGPQSGCHRRGHLPDGRVALDLEQRRRLDRPELGDSPEIVPQQIHDHHILGPVFLGAGQGVPQRLVLVESASARARPFHGPRHDPVTCPLEKEFRRGREYPPLSHIQIGAVGSLLGCAEALIEREAVSRDFCVQSHRVVDLIDGPGRDGFLDRADRRRMRLRR